jgi:anti-sigma factor RsiW
MNCEMDDETLLRFLNNELNLEERIRSLEHLKSCSLCKERLEEERNLSRLMHQSRPLFSAPDSLRIHISALLNQGVAKDRRLAGFLQQLADVFQSHVRGWSFATIGIVLIALGLIFVPNIAQHARASSYIETAVAAHRNYLSGVFAPEIQSNSAQEIATWITGRVSFRFRLPVAQDASEARYKIVGARLLSLKGLTAALVMYENRTEPQERVSLLIAPSSSAVVAGGEEIRSGHLLFHAFKSGGFRVITWNVHGLSYALVSSISGSAQQSCLVCHQDVVINHPSSHQRARE